jgi:lipid A ethanolaminephosphotransferase
MLQSKSFKSLRPNTTRAKLPLLLALYFVVILNIPAGLAIQQILATTTAISTGFIVSLPMLLLAVFYLFFTVFNFKYLAKPCFISITLATALMNYSMYYYGVLFDTDMLVNILESNSNEVLSYTNSAVYTWVLGFGIIPSILIAMVKLQPQSRSQQCKQILLGVISAVLTIVIIAALYYKDYAAIKRNNHDINKRIIPLHFVCSSIEYFKNYYFSKPLPYRKLGLDATNMAQHHAGKNQLLILVIGETARSNNYQLNGYARPTNQYTSKYPVLSFKNVTSCGTNTAVSIPCMFGLATREEYSTPTANNQDNLLDILQYAGLNILWLDNNAGCYHVCRNVATINIAPTKSTSCNGNTCFDEVLLEQLPQQLNALQGKDTVIVLHLIGSHGPTYYQRFPSQYRYFTPNCLQSDIQNCTAEQLINTYDNSILYTDFVLAHLIEILAAQTAHWDSAMLYVSDHGESLGEKGLYLHGFPYNLAPREQTSVPLITWFNQEFIALKNLDLACLQHHADTNQYSHDNLFHSVLGLLDIKTSTYQAELDLFKSCRTK